MPIVTACTTGHKALIWEFASEWMVSAYPIPFAQTVKMPPGVSDGGFRRSELATQAAMNGASEFAIIKQTGRRSVATVRKYINCTLLKSPF